jgi:TonB-linked SusC/RagA family outer membrane protein
MKAKFTLKLLLVLGVLGGSILQNSSTFAANRIMAAEQKISGKVTDENGNGLPGVNVKIKGSSRGTSTDSNGQFNLGVTDDKAVLVFSFTGYVTQEISLQGRSTINVQLVPDVQSLDEVVVVGYGTQRKVDLTGAVSSITSKDIANRPNTSPDQALSGRISGVHIANRSGDPGAPIDVRIRGVGSTGNNQPLWVIDGVPIVQTSNISVNTASYTESNPLAGINPSDIESIDVLKDASAAAIYGARAANGVVIVTTKRGKEGRTTLTYDGYVAAQSIAQNRRIDVLDVSQYVSLQKELGRDFSSFSSKPFYNWQDNMFQTAIVRNHNLTVTGGTKNLNFSIGAGYHGQGGVERSQGFERISLKANVDAKAGKYFKFGESLLISSTDRLVQSEGGNFAAFNSMKNAPYYQPFDSTDPFGYTPSNASTRGDGASGANYMWATDTRYNETRVKSRKVLANVYGEFEPIEGLKFKVSGGIDYNVGDGFFFQEASAQNYGTAGTPRSSLLVQERPIEQTTNFANTLNYRKKIGKHDFSILVGYEETSFRYDKIRVQGRGLANSDIRMASKAQTVAAANEADHWALRGMLGRVFYSYNDKYLLTFNVRRDQTSRFSPDNRTGIFPSLSAGWRLSEEDFLKNNNTINDLKLRLSWGQSGNQFTGNNFAYLPTMSSTIFYVIGAGQGVVLAPAPTIFANPNLKWEVSTQSDIGADVSLFNRRLNITADYYLKVTKDLLLSQPIPMTSGYFLPADANLGEIKNSGIELGVNYQNQIGDFKYNIGGNITTVNNKVTSLGGIPEVITGTGGDQTHRTTEGESLAYFFGYKTNGIYQSQAEVDADKTVDANSAGRQPGDIRFVDVNGDGKIDANDKTKIGSSIPTYFYGINLGGSYKGFDVSILFQGVGGMSIYNAARASLESMRTGDNQSVAVLGRWTGAGTSTTMPRATASDPNNNTRFSDRWIESGAYMRLKNIQIGYAIPASFLKKVSGEYISSSRIYIGIQNLMTFTKYKGYDPEVTRGASFQKGEFPLANGVDSGGSPQPTIMQFGWQFSF